ncbi:MAG: MBOAT family protein [Treponema sp.]|nr:MBOAT family protein [Treponema sp.]
MGILGFFKYFNFFIENFVTVFTLLGVKPNISTFNIILPVGISFYTFQTMSYSIDVYKGKLEPVKDFISFMAFVSFFPQLMAGPIERASNLLPQLQKRRTFGYDKAVDGTRQILWGLFKKVVIADNCAVYVNYVFDNYQRQSGITLWVAVAFFAVQVYGDFSGYSDIAIGSARLFGINLMRNFNYPLFSRDIAEYWRRWHISQSTWFRDYVYFPLGGSRVSKAKVVRNTYILFLVSGFWHGANWTFVIWGLFNATLFLPLLLLNKNREHKEIVASDRMLPNIKELFQIGLTFFWVTLTRVLFRAENMTQACGYFRGMANKSLFLINSLHDKRTALAIIFLIAIMLIVEWIGRRDQFGIEKLGNKWNPVFRWAMYYSILLVIFIFAGKSQEFVYFQF